MNEYPKPLPDDTLEKELAAILRLSEQGWGLLISATGVHRDEGFDTICVDNGAWTSYASGEPWDPEPFRTVVRTFGRKAQFVAAPDIVAGGLESLACSLSWLPELLEQTERVLIPVQDGMAPWDVEPHLNARVGIFVGGTTGPATERGRPLDPRGGWKWRSLPYWAHLARKTGCYLHVGRVNTKRRILECIRVGADSFDGTSASVFGSTLNKLDRARKQTAFALEGDDE